MYRTGCLIGEPRGRKAIRSYNQLGGGEVYVSAMGSEIARGTGWRRGDDPSVRLEPEGLLRRFDFSQQPEFLRRASDWLAALPEGLNALDAMTLFDQEMVWGAWGGPLTLGYPDAYSFTLYPYGHRAILDAMLRLPWQYRQSVRLREDIMASRWKELLEVPINRRPFRVAVRKKAHRPVMLAKAGLSWKAWNRLLLRARSGSERPPSGR